MRTRGADAADDPAIWVAPGGENARIGGRLVTGFVAGTDKRAGLHIYSFDGTELQFLPNERLNNVDLGEIHLSGRSQVLLGASDGARKGIAFYRFDPAERSLTNRVRGFGFVQSDLAEPYGFCMGKSDGRLHGVLIGKAGEVRVYRIDTASSGPSVVEVGRFGMGSKSEGCVVDERGAALYVAEEGRGLWKYSLRRLGSRELVEPVGRGILKADVEGVTLLAERSRRYVLVSSQGDSGFAVWRVDTPRPVYSGRFRIRGSQAVDRVTATDGIDAKAGVVGQFRDGLVVVQDGRNDRDTQNFKLIEWRSIRNALRL